MSVFANRNVLFLHHYEAVWATPMQEMYGISFDEYTDSLCHFIDTHIPPIEHVIITRWEEYGHGEEHFPVLCFLEEKGITHQFETVPYGNVESCFLESHFPDLIPSKKTPGEEDPDIKEMILIEKWMRELQCAKSVLLAGAFDRECIADAEDILDHVCGKEGYRRIEGLIVGSGVDYDFAPAHWQEHPQAPQRRSERQLPRPEGRGL